MKDSYGNLISHPKIYVWIDGEKKGWIEPNKWPKSFLANQGSHKIDVVTNEFQYAGNFYQSIEGTNTMYAKERYIAEEQEGQKILEALDEANRKLDEEKAKAEQEREELQRVIDELRKEQEMINSNEPKFITLYINDWDNSQGYLLDDGTVEFRGNVSDEEGNFVFDVEIIITDLYSEDIVIHSTTDEQGNFFVKWEPVYPEHWIDEWKSAPIIFTVYVKTNMGISSTNSVFITSFVMEEKSAEEPIETIEEPLETIEEPLETIEEPLEEPVEESKPKFCFLWWCWY